MAAEVGRLEELQDWLTAIMADEWAWHAKRLSANDTGATGAHQAGPYIAREFAFAVAPGLAAGDRPRWPLSLTLASHDQESTPNLIHYTSKRECHLTGLGGRQSALLDSETTGAIFVLAVDPARSVATGWIADTIEEEEAIEGAIGPVEPGTVVMRLPAATGGPGLLVAAPATCQPDMSALPVAWASKFPTGRELTAEAIRRRPGAGSPVDRRIIERYRCEYGLFKVVETAHTLSRVTGGFATVDAFLEVAKTVDNRRKSRAGRSLELQLAAIFGEEGIRYEPNKPTEGRRKPDFLFPSAAAYHAGDPTLMLGVKTSVKERWRQILDEAARIPEKYLFTLSEGVSIDQFTQMDGVAVRLVVPAPNITKFPTAIRPRLLTLADFVALVS